MCFLERLVELLKPRVLGCEPAFRGCVYDQHHLAFVFLEGDWLPLLCWAVFISI